VRYNNVRVPIDHLLGPEGGGRMLAQRRLGAAASTTPCARWRLQEGHRHDVERALSRQSHGKVIAEHQMVQEAIADSYAEYHMLRLLVLWTAWTIDRSSTREARTQIAACKYSCAKIQKDIVFRAIHMFGSLV